jgi:hypothetical protein
MLATKMNALTTVGSASTKSPLLVKSATIFQYTHTSASSLIAAFADAKKKRGNPRGVLTDQEQDILRAALVMSCAELDASLKQAIRDCLEFLLEKDKRVRDGFEKFIRKRVSGEGDVLELASGAKFLSIILAEKEPRKRLIEEYIKELTGESLQSVEEIMRTSAALGIEVKDLGLDIPRLKEIFGIRNKIIHELDINLEAPKRKRRVRGQEDLLDTSDVILSAAKSVLEAIDKKL